MKKVIKCCFCTKIYIKINYFFLEKNEFLELSLKKNYGPELNKRLDKLLSKPLADITGNKKLNHVTVATCYSYYCPFARTCVNKTKKPSKISVRKCLRFLPDKDKPAATLSELALDLLSSREQKGGMLSSQTKSILNEYRPSGPLRQTL